MALKMASDVVRAINYIIKVKGDMPLIVDSDWCPVRKVDVVKEGEHITGNEEDWITLKT